MRIDEIKANLKKEYPTLKRGNDQDGYAVLNDEEYEAIISEWANNLVAEENFRAEQKAMESSKAELLNRLGITEDEAKLLLA